MSRVAAGFRMIDVPRDQLLAQIKRLLQLDRLVAFLGGEIAVARRHRQAVRLAHGGASRRHRHRQVQIPPPSAESRAAAGNPCGRNTRLSAARSRKASRRPWRRRRNGRGGWRPPRGDVRLPPDTWMRLPKPSGIHLSSPTGETPHRPAPSNGNCRKVARFRPRIAAEILFRPELQRINENRGDRQIINSAAACVRQ